MTKTQELVINKAQENGGTYVIQGNGVMRQLDAALQLARKYPKRYSASQPEMFKVIFTVLK
jgi:hypothetical protein